MRHVGIASPQKYQMLAAYLVCRFLSQGIQHVCKELILPLPPQDTREPLFKWREADQPHLSAFANLLKVHLEIFGVSGRGFSHTIYQETSCGAGASVVIRLVLHSGHYDLLYA